MEHSTRDDDWSESWKAGYEAGISHSAALVDSLMTTSAGNLTRPLLLWLRTRILELLDESKNRAA